MQWNDPEKVQSDQNMTANAKKNRAEYGVDRPALVTTEITRMTEADRIKNELKNVLQLSLTDEQAEQLDTFYKMICEKNKVMNLTRITDFEDALKKHIADSLSLVRAAELPGDVHSVLDMGSGAGFPGMPVKIVWPDLNVTMMDSVGKKMAFIDTVIQTLHLTDVRAVHARAEEAARKMAYREHFDLCLSRAVANLATLSEYCLPFVRIGGRFAAYKAADSDQEIQRSEKAIRDLGGEIEEVRDFDLYDLKRRIIVIRKIKPTSGIYPRNAGTPSREPIQ